MNENKKNYFQQNGFFIFRELLADKELTALRKETDQAIYKRTPPILFEDASPETLADIPKQYKTADGKIFRRLERVIDRGGAFERVILGPVARAITALLSPPISVCLNRHNMLMLKAPHNPAPIPWHQDAAVWNEGTYEHVSAIVAIDDFLPDNGCLEVVPESHRLAPIALGSDHIPTVRVRYDELIRGRSVKVDLRAGDAVLFHGLVLHGSEGNFTAHSRRSLTAAFYPGDLCSVSTAQGARTPQTKSLSTF